MEEEGRLPVVLLFVISDQCRISRIVNWISAAIIVASAYANATGNGKRSFGIDIHEADLGSRVDLEFVGVHKTIGLADPRLIK